MRIIQLWGHRCDHSTLTCNRSGRCTSCFRSHRTVLQPFRILLRKPQDVPTSVPTAATRPKDAPFRKLQLLLPEPQNVPAMFQDVATAGFEAAERSRNVSERCKCCCYPFRRMLLEPLLVRAIIAYVTWSCRLTTLLERTFEPIDVTKGSTVTINSIPRLSI